MIHSGAFIAHRFLDAFLILCHENTVDQLKGSLDALLRELERLDSNDGFAEVGLEREFDLLPLHLALPNRELRNGFVLPVPSRLVLHKHPGREQSSCPYHRAVVTLPSKYTSALR